jgi:hypothetical protein
MHGGVIVSEYMTFETQPTDDPLVLDLVTNLPLAPDGDEYYADYQAGDQGSPLAQMLFNAVEGLRALALSEGTLRITRAADVPWEALIDDVRDALRDFFL